MARSQETGVPAWVVDVDGLEGGFSVGILQQAEVLTQEETEPMGGFHHQIGI